MMTHVITLDHDSYMCPCTLCVVTCATLNFLGQFGDHDTFVCLYTRYVNATYATLPFVGLGTMIGRPQPKADK